MADQVRKEPELRTITVNAMEYAALLDVDRMIRIAMSVPDASEMLVGAIQALDLVRAGYGIPGPETPQPAVQQESAKLSGPAQGLIKRALDS